MKRPGQQSGQTVRRIVRAIGDELHHVLCALFHPIVDELIQQVRPIFKVPIERAFGGAQLFGQPFNFDFSTPPSAMAAMAAKSQSSAVRLLRFDGLLSVIKAFSHICCQVVLRHFRTNIRIRMDIPENMQYILRRM